MHFQCHLQHQPVQLIVTCCQFICLGYTHTAITTHTRTISQSKARYLVSPPVTPLLMLRCLCLLRGGLGSGVSSATSCDMPLKVTGDVSEHAKAHSSLKAHSLTLLGEQVLQQRQRRHQPVGFCRAPLVAVALLMLPSWSLEPPFLLLFLLLLLLLLWWMLSSPLLPSCHSYASSSSASSSEHSLLQLLPAPALLLLPSLLLHAAVMSCRS